MEAWQAGGYDGSSNIYLKIYNANQETLAHEFGHFVDDKKTEVRGTVGRWQRSCDNEYNTSETRAFSEGWADAFKYWYKESSYLEEVCPQYSGLLIPIKLHAGFWDLQDSGTDDGREECEISFSGVLTNGMLSGVDTWPELTSNLKSYYSASVDEQIDSVTAVNQLYAAELLLAGGSRVPLTALESRLHQNEPNPFNPSTAISFETAGSDNRIVKLAVYDIRGKLVRLLVSGERKPGRHTVFWDGKDSNGNQVGSGVYFYRMETGSKVRTRKMVLVK